MASGDADMGLIGLAVMGENLALNMLNHGYKVAVFNRTTSKVTSFAEGRGKGKDLVACMSPEEFCASLKKPRKMILLVQVFTLALDLFSNSTFSLLFFPSPLFFSPNFPRLENLLI